MTRIPHLIENHRASLPETTRGFDYADLRPLVQTSVRRMGKKYGF